MAESSPPPPTIRHTLPIATAPLAGVHFLPAAAHRSSSPIIQEGIDEVRAIKDAPAAKVNYTFESMFDDITRGAARYEPPGWVVVPSRPCDAGSGVRDAVKPESLPIICASVIGEACRNDVHGWKLKCKSM
jgi:hypothetical protein